MEITINSNAKLEIESSGDYKKDAKKACRFAYIKKDKKINKNFQRFIEASKKIKEAEAAGEDLPESVFKKWTPEDERDERKAEWESKQLEKLTAIMSEEIIRIDGESKAKAKDSDSKFEHIFKKIEKGITKEKMEQYRKFCENSKETPRFDVKQTTPPQTKKEPVAPSTDFTPKALLPETSESATTKTPIAPSTDFSKEKKSPPEIAQSATPKSTTAPQTRKEIFIETPGTERLYKSAQEKWGEYLYYWGLGAEVVGKGAEALARSVEFELSYGVGLGASLGAVAKAKAEIVPVKQTHLWTDEGHEMRTSSDIGVTADLWKDKVGAAAKYSHAWHGENESALGLYAGPASLWHDNRKEGDLKLSVGAGGYLFSGGEANINFNISKFKKLLEEIK